MKCRKIVVPLHRFTKNYYSVSREISKKLMEMSSFPLISIGVSGKAYLRRDAIAIITLARHNIVPVLGGDVYCKSEFDNDIHITYDNWYCNREEFESLKDYVERSCDVAEQYILNYTAQKGFEPIFDIRLAEEWQTT